jgi:hypothetical protein
MSGKLNTAIAVIGIDIGKNSFHVMGHDQRGAIVLHQKWSRGQVPSASTPWTWKTDLTMSRPIVVIVCMLGSSKLWGP